MPDLGLKLNVQNKSYYSALKDIAVSLFGKDNISQNLTHQIAPNPLVLFCSDSKNQPFDGDKVDGYSLRFCSKYLPVQTDVGICVGSNSIQYWHESEIVERSLEDKIQDDLRNIEHLVVLSIDKFGEPYEFDVCLITFTLLENFYYHYFSDIVAKNKSQKL